MRNTKLITTAAIAAAAATTLALGPLNPPAGAPSDTSPSLSDVLNAVQGTGAPAGNRQEALPGINTSPGLIRWDNGAPETLIGVDIDLERVIGGPGGSAPATGNFAVTLAAGTLGARAADSLALAQVVQSIEIQLLAPGSAQPLQLVTLTNVRVTAVRTTLRQRGDLSYAPVEEFILLANEIEIEDASGITNITF